MGNHGHPTTVTMLQSREGTIVRDVTSKQGRKFPTSFLLLCSLLPVFLDQNHLTLVIR
jgi:hypothetical protein